MKLSTLGIWAVAEGIQVLDDSQTMIIAVSPPKVEEVEAEEIEGEEVLEPEQEEPELITRKRSDDEE